MNETLSSIEHLIREIGLFSFDWVFFYLNGCPLMVLTCIMLILSKWFEVSIIKVDWLIRIAHNSNIFNHIRVSLNGPGNGGTANTMVNSQSDIKLNNSKGLNFS